MSYRIEYDSKVNKYEVKPEKNYLMPIMVFSAMILVLFFFQSDRADAVCSFLIPGEDAVTVQAFSAMTNDLRSGAELWDAVEVFCRAVIHGK